MSTLSISKVLREFLNIPFQCHVLTPADMKTGEVKLEEGILQVVILLERISS